MPLFELDGVDMTLINRVGHCEEMEGTLSDDDQLAVIRYRLSAARDATTLTLVGAAATRLGCSGDGRHAL